MAEVVPFVVIATGQSLTAEQLRQVRHLPCIAVSDAVNVAPWSIALVSQDLGWWKQHPEAMRFAGRKFSGCGYKGTEKVPFEGLINSGTNSGLMACHVAATKFEAKRLLLLGVDLHGTHYFGPHKPPLKNTSAHRFEHMRTQFARWRHPGVEVINCNLGSALSCFPMARLEDVLCKTSGH